MGRRVALSGGVSRRGKVVAAMAAAVAVLAGAGYAVLPRLSPFGGGQVPPSASVIRSEGSTAYLAPFEILFDVDSAALPDAAIPVLRSIAADIMRSGLTGRVQVEGYTDDTGSNDHNLMLSRSRAQVVTDWLATDGGIARARITPVGSGESRPAEPDDSFQHRQANRRVVIAVLRAPGASASPSASVMSRRSG